MLLVFLAFKWKKEATAEAVEEAGKIAETWLQENADGKIADKLKELDSDIVSKISGVDGVVDEKIKDIEKDVKRRIDAIYEEHKKVMELYEKLKKTGGDINQLDDVQADEDTISEALEQAEAKANATNAFQDWFAAATLAYRQASYSKAIEFLDKSIVSTKSNALIVRCLYNKGVALAAFKTTEKIYEAIAIYDEAHREFGANQNEEIRALLAEALVNKGVWLGQLGKTEEELEIYDKVYEDFGAHTNEGVMVQVARALVGKGACLEQQGKTEEAIKICDMVYEKFKTSQNEELMAQVATALYAKGFMLGRQGRIEEEIKTYGMLYKDFGAMHNKEIAAQVAKGLSGKGFRFVQQHRKKEAKELYLEAMKFNPSHLNAYTNLFELWLIDGDEFDENIIKQFLEYAKDDKQNLLQYEMIMNIKDSLITEQTEKIAELKSKYPDTDSGGWSWDELKTWVETIKDEAAKERVKKTIAEFENWGKV